MDSEFQTEREVETVEGQTAVVDTNRDGDMKGTQIYRAVKGQNHERQKTVTETMTDTVTETETVTDRDRERQTVERE